MRGLVNTPLRSRVVSVVGYVLDPVVEVVEVGHLVKHRPSDFADRAVDILGADVDFPVDGFRFRVGKFHHDNGMKNGKRNWTLRK